MAFLTFLLLTAFCRDLFRRLRRLLRLFRTRVTQERFLLPKSSTNTLKSMFLGLSLDLLGHFWGLLGAPRGAQKATLSFQKEHLQHYHSALRSSWGPSGGPDGLWGPVDVERDPRDPPNDPTFYRNAFPYSKTRFDGSSCLTDNNLYAEFYDSSNLIQFLIARCAQT